MSWQRSTIEWSGSAGAGILLALAFPGPALFPLAWVGLVPYLAFLSKGRPLAHVLAANTVFGVSFFGVVLSWIPSVLTEYGHFPGVAACLLLVLLAFALSLYLLPFSLGVAWLARRSLPAALAWAPGGWLLCEYLRKDAAASGFPWANLGYSQYPFSTFIQVAELGGAELLSFVIVTFNALLFAALVNRSVTTASLALLLPLGGVLYGAVSQAGEPNSSPTLKIGLVQPNVAIYQDREYYTEVYFRRLPERYLELVSEGVDWVIFPEMPNPFRLQRAGAFQTVWTELVRTRGTPLLMNSTGISPDSPVLHNSTFLLGADGIEWRYNKQRLVPFGEYVPFGGAILGFVQGMVGEVAYFTPGAGGDSGRVKGNVFGVLICYESIFPELSRGWSVAGAEILVNVTNDAWFGRTAAPEQHLQMAAFRAIEQRRPIVRVANSGYTTVIDVFGREGPRMGLFEEGTMVVEVSGRKHRTLYSYVQPVGVPSLILLSLSLSWFQLTRRRPRE